MDDVRLPGFEVYDGDDVRTHGRGSARSGRAEFITRGDRRRVWAAEQKRAIVLESLAPGTTPTDVARRCGIGSGLLHTWRRQLQEGRLGSARRRAPRFARVRLIGEAPRLTVPGPVPPLSVPSPPAPLPQPPSPQTPPCAGLIEIALPGGAAHAFRGRRGRLTKLLWRDGVGLCLLAERLRRGHVVRPMTSAGAVSLTSAQLATLREGCGWRAPACSRRPELAGSPKPEGFAAVIAREALACRRQCRPWRLRADRPRHPAGRPRGFAANAARRGGRGVVAAGQQQAALQGAVQEREAENETLRLLIQRLLRHRFGRRSEQLLLEGFTACLRRLDETGVIACQHPEIAAHQFFGLIQEFAIWPHVMAIGPAAKARPPPALVIEEVVLLFLSRYEVPGPAQGASAAAKRGAKAQERPRTSRPHSGDGRRPS